MNVPVRKEFGSLILAVGGAQKLKVQVTFGVYLCESNIPACRSQRMWTTDHVEGPWALGLKDASHLMKQSAALPKTPSPTDQIFSTTGPSEVKSSVWAHRLRERKNRVIYEEISDPEEDD